MPGSRPSFADDVKGELAGLQPGRPCCRHAELHAIVDALAAEPAEDSVIVRVPRNAVARKIVQLAKATGGRVEELRKGSTERRPSYRLRLSLAESQASADLCCARAALRGAFIARGTVGDPASGYHLEIALPPASFEALRPLIERLELPRRTSSRRGRTIWYLKGADGIRRVLGLMGASRGVMRLEHDRIVRDMRSQANRRVNSETANLQKRLRTARAQVKRIHELHRSDPHLRRLPAALREAADLRLTHPQAGLQALASAARVSKSAMAGRLRRLMQAHPDQRRRLRTDAARPAARLTSGA